MKSKKKGNRGEDIAIKALARIGVLIPEEIGTPFTVTGPVMKNGRPTGQVQGFFGKRVSGDIRGVREDGKSVLAEVKYVDNLVWSTMTKHGEHQSARLDEHALYAISLVVWVRSADEVYILRWPNPDFGPRKRVAPERAARLNITHINFIRTTI